MLPASSCTFPLVQSLSARFHLSNPCQLRPPRLLPSRSPTQLCFSPPPQVHPFRPTPLTYPPQRGVHLPQCPAPKPLLPGCPARPPASLPAVPRAAASLLISLPRQLLRRPATTSLCPEQGKPRAFSQRALREGSPHFTPSPGNPSPGDYNSQRPPGRGGADFSRAPPHGWAPPPVAEVCARIPWREFGTLVERPGFPGVTLRTVARGAGGRQVERSVRG